MKAKSTIRNTMNKLFVEARRSNCEDRTQMAYDMATALQWIIEDTSWNPVSLLPSDARNKGDVNG